MWLLPSCHFQPYHPAWWTLLATADDHEASLAAPVWRPRRTKLSLSLTTAGHSTILNSPRWWLGASPSVPS
ncbi:Os01g0747451 [Oryza sativa Japonica Group]|uniref:Os01g0747451 protein n=1 Tax=Oryza sativa subsp. japonica TaxID=39947 RepID=A0A0P0V868_ORYSJ|nr:hypothetical protein EE612_005706 [Oryza sativa]BAS74326.1 Os01g0747451 [Oryza sativa Japonica Group]